ncbi:MAG: ribonuclease HII [Desulfobulbus sp.]|nr:ribonuclease HII [Desulfobulbus sp.]
MYPCIPPPCLHNLRNPGDAFFFERWFRTAENTLIAGVDEAGRGPLAGPVVAACVILPPDCDYHHFRDSKALTARQREHLFTVLQNNGSVFGVGQAGVREIESLNILQASLLAMRRAVASCIAVNHGKCPEYLLVDGRFSIPVSIPQLSLIQGESKSASIAAASIVAKVTRDRFMAEAHVRYPQYGFDRHRGYPTRTHREAIALYGPCPLHRRTFRGVVEFV